MAIKHSVLVKETNTFSQGLIALLDQSADFIYTDPTFGSKWMFYKDTLSEILSNYEDEDEGADKDSLKELETLIAEMQKEETGMLMLVSY